MAGFFGRLLKHGRAWLYVVLASLLVLSIGCGGGNVAQQQPAEVPNAKPDRSQESPDNGDVASDGRDTSTSNGRDTGASGVDDTTGESAAPAPAPTSAPAPSPAGAAEPLEGSEDKEAYATEEEYAADEADMLASDEAHVSTARPRPQGGPAPLKAGEVDDNDAFALYQEYLATYDGPPAHPVDVSEWYVLTVLGKDQRPLLDARVSVYDGSQQIFAGRTYAGGKVLFVPGALDVSDNAAQFRVVAEYGEARGETTLARHEQERVEIVLPDAIASEALRLDILFLLDTTGSMDDELSRIQETIDTIAQRIDGFVPRPALRFGVVAYRDRGDAYVTRSYDFIADVETFRTLLNGFTADGGGDTREAVNEAFHEAVHGVQWSDDAVRLIFLVADAGPHLDYDEDFHYATEIQEAVQRGIKVYPIAASNTDEFAEYVFRQMAQQTLARFIFLTYQPGQQSGVPGEETSLQAGDQSYTVERLDDVIVGVVHRELAAVRGVQ